MPHEKIDREELREIVRETVRETMRELGVDTEDMLEVQRDMSFLRDLRKARDSATAKAVVVAVGVLITAALGALALGIKSWLHQS